LEKDETLPGGKLQVGKRHRNSKER